MESKTYYLFGVFPVWRVRRDVDQETFYAKFRDRFMAELNAELGKVRR